MKTAAYKTNNCAGCGEPIGRTTIRCHACHQVFRLSLPKKKKAATASCVDCGKTCSRYSKRCWTCAQALNQARKALKPAPVVKNKICQQCGMRTNLGRMVCATCARKIGKPTSAQTEPPPPPVISAPVKELSIPDLEEYLFKIDIFIGKKFRKLPPDVKLRAGHGIAASIKAQRENARKGFEITFRLDTAPIREIIEDAGRGLFFFEELDAERRAPKERIIRSYSNVWI